MTSADLRTAILSTVKRLQPFEVDALVAKLMPMMSGAVVPSEDDLTAIIDDVRSRTSFSDGVITNWHYISKAVNEFLITLAGWRKG